MTLDYRENKKEVKEGRDLNRELKDNNVELGEIDSRLNSLRAQKEGIPSLDLSNPAVNDALFQRYIHNNDIKQKIESLH